MVPPLPAVLEQPTTNSSPAPKQSFFRSYIDYVGNTESPDIYHRWTAVSMIASTLARSYWMDMGTFLTYPNMYIMLQGLPAVRKSSAIRVGNKILKASGYDKFASDRMSREMFITEMYHLNKVNADNYSFEELLEMTIDPDPVSEITVHAGEFLDFIGQGDKDYLMLFTNLWDNAPSYKNPKLTSKTVVVSKPTINILGASTPETLNMAFPPEVLDSGTLSRFLFIHSAGTGKKVLIPKAPDPNKAVPLVQLLRDIRDQVKGPATMSPEAQDALDYLYKNYEKLEDQRFGHYNARRLDHLIKLCLIVSASRLSTTISERDVLIANTMLGAAEYGMPKALGHFGRSKISIIQHMLIEYLEELGRPVVLKDIYSKFSTHFSKEVDFLTMAFDMQHAGSLIGVKDEDGNHIGVTVQDSTFPSWLTPLMVTEELTKQERGVLGI